MGAELARARVCCGTTCCVIVCCGTTCWGTVCCVVAGRATVTVAVGRD